MIAELEHGTSVYLCRRCWQVREARPDVTWLHACNGGPRGPLSGQTRFDWVDRTDFRYLHNQERLLNGKDRVELGVSLGRISAEVYGLLRLLEGRK